ncbi:MAG TPA: gliding motility-associated C-terminal domain-containing protein, partial [Cytophagales bacterium]|nr:gliding motility-associated C-terminal domain-containing protein [Cytophagales bacterium]
LKVLESVAGCASDTSAEITVKVDSTISTLRPQLVALPPVICQDSLVTLQLSQTQKDIVYTLKDNGVVRATKTATLSGEVLNFGPIGVALTPREHVFTISASSDGCDTVQLTSTATVTINARPNADAIQITADDTILCDGQSVSFDVETTKGAEYSYQVLANGTNLGTALPGNQGKRTFGTFSLPVGIHQISVIESVTGCSSDTTASITVQVDAPPADTALVQVSTDTSCTDASITVSVSKTQKDITYTLFYRQDNKSPVKYQSQKANANAEVLTYLLLNLGAGDYEFYVKANNAGCDSITLTSKAKVVVTQKPDDKMILEYNSPICIGDTVALKMRTTQARITFDIYRKSGVDSTLLGNTTNNMYTTAPYMSSGVDTLFVIAKTKGCTPVRLDAQANIEINKLPNLDLVSEGNSVCHSDPVDVSIKLLGTESPWLYSAKVSDTSYTKVGGGDLEYTIFKRKLVKGANIINFMVTVPGCGMDTVAVDTVYSIGEIKGLSGKSYVCENSIETYTVPLVGGATSYEFTIPAGATKVSQNLNSITIQWGDTNTSGVIKVRPNAKLAVCDELIDSMFVRVLTPFSDQVDFINEDTVCIGTIDWIGVTRLKGISWDSLVKIEGDAVSYLDTIPRTFTNYYSKYQVKYNQAGKFEHVYYLRNPCTNKDSIVRQTVVVLPRPIADAGEYPVIDMKHYPREVVLDGSNSSLSTDMFKFTYQWSIKPFTNINNSDKIVASFVPEQTKQTVYLTVANEHKGMCPTVDSATIVIDLGIFIPNIFTPNSDGDHDTWEILNVNAFYPDVQVDIYSKWGTLIYSSKGYPNAWDGTKNGQEVPSATYYYVIDLKKPGFKPVAGSVTIIR